MFNKIDDVYNRANARNHFEPILDNAVRNIGSDTLIPDSLSLTREPFATHFPVCETHATCDRRVLTCPPSDPDCPFGFEGWITDSAFEAGWGFAAATMGQRQFCASACFTGGCGANAAELPGAVGSPGFCQPCGACTENPRQHSCTDSLCLLPGVPGGRRRSRRRSRAA